MNFIITGASGGIGREIALKLAGEKGNRIFALSRNEKLLKELSGKSDNIYSIVCDLRDTASINRAVEKIFELTDTIEVLINNAGSLKLKSFEMLGDDDWQDIYLTNVFGPVRLVRSVMPLLRKGNLKKGTFKSHVLMISSIGGITGTQKFSGLSAYSSSKGALTILSECLAEELRAEGIAVNCLALGSVETEMFKAAFPGFKAGSDVHTMGQFIAEFALSGPLLFNGKTIPVSLTTP